MSAAGNVRVAVTGAVYVAGTAASAPADATAGWATTWSALGYISADGIEETYSDDTTEIRAWQGGDLVRRLITGSSASFHFTAIETSAVVLSLFHKGSTLAGTSGARSLPVKSALTDIRKFGFDVLDGTNNIRIVVDSGEVTERGNIAYTNDAPVGYELTISAYPNAQGVVMTKYSSDPAWGP